MKKTVFVVGAGASTEFGFPLGVDLVNRIRNALMTDFDQGELTGSGVWDGVSPTGPLYRAVGSRGQLTEAHIRSARDLIGALSFATSIDRLLNSRRDDALAEVIGKVAIAHAISQGERESSALIQLSLENGIATRQGLPQISRTWLGNFLRHIGANQPPTDIAKALEPFQFITFNYDRCIEQFLVHALVHSWRQSHEDAAAIVRSLNIIHVYGDLGAIPALGGPTWFRFGPGDEVIGDASRNIRVFTEATDDGTQKAINSAIGNAKKIIFLGFGFDAMNMKVLFAEPYQGQALVGTNWLSEPDTAAMLDRILPGGTLRSFTYFRSENCYEFVAGHSDAIFGDAVRWR